MKEYIDILRLGVSEGLTAGQRKYLLTKIKDALSPRDYLKKGKQFNECIFNDSVIDMLDTNKFENEMNRIQGIIKEHLRKVDKMIP